MRATTTQRSTCAEQVKFDSLAVYSVSTTKRGRVRCVSAYLDVDTGEVIPAEQLSIPILDLRDKLPARAEALDYLRPEVRQFAAFVLRFANKRRGISPGIDTLCRWYAEMHGRRSQDVRRYISKLTEVGVLAGENLLGPLFQRTGGRTKDHLGEEYRAWCTYTRLRASAQTDAEATASAEAWAAIRRAARPVHATAGA